MDIMNQIPWSTDNRCRACMTEEATMISLLDGHNLELFSKCTSLEIVQPDELPTYTCSECFIELQNVHKFRQKCLMSDLQFRKEMLGLYGMVMVRDIILVWGVMEICLEKYLQPVPSSNQHCKCMLCICICAPMWKLCLQLVFSIAIIVILGLLITNCKVEYDLTIDQNATLEQLEFFYKAFDDCGYKEEANIPSSDKMCSIVELRVIPVAGVAISLNFLLAILIQIMVLDSQFFLDKTMNKYSIPVSFICIPIGTLLAMSLAWVAVTEYTTPQLCWLGYSVSERKESFSHFAATKLIPVILILYKPLELGTFYIYGSNFFQGSSSILLLFTNQKAIT